MADYFDQQPNFTNPDYASEAQRATARAYAEQLLKRSGADITRPTGALANMIDALTSNLVRNRANTQEAGMHSQYLQELQPYIAALQGGPQGGLGASPQATIPSVAPAQAFSGEPPPATGPRPGGPVQSSPTVMGDAEGVKAGFYPPSIMSPNERVAQAFNGPVGGASSAPAGAPPPVASPVAGGPAAPLSSTAMAQLLLAPNDMVAPNQKAMIEGLLPRQAQDITGQRTITGPLTPERLQGYGQGVVQGRIAPVKAGSVETTIAIPAGRGAVSQGGLGAQMAPIAKVGQDIAAENARVAGGAGGEAENIKANVGLANTSLQIQQDAQYMHDLIKSNPNQFFGPLAKPGNEALRLFSSLGLPIDTKSLAAADAVEKTNASLAASLQQKWGLNPSAISIAIGSTPGNEKSMRGTMDLLSMINQAAKRDHYVATELYNQARDSGQLANFSKIKADYYAAHPLRNENTGHLVMDPIPVSSPAAARGLTKGTPIQLPDGRIGWVP